MYCIPGVAQSLARLVKPGLNTRGFMLPTAALFIDSSNFYHSLKEENRLPFEYSSLFGELSSLYELKQIFFYDAVKDIAKDPNGYAKQQKFHAQLRNLKLPLKIKTRKLKYLANLTKEQVDGKAKEIGIVDSCKEKLWGFLQALGLIRLTKEKGVDVLLAVDAIEAARSKKYQAIIILSGDADFVPAVNLIKSLGVLVVNLHPYSGSSNELRNSCNKHILVDFDEKGVFLE